MASLRRKRKREIQDEEPEYLDNFDYFRKMAEGKRRKTDENTRRSPLQPLPDSPPRTPDSTAGQKTPLTRTKSLILTPFSSWKKTIRSKVRRSFRRRQLKGLQDYNLPHFSQDVQSHLEGRRKKDQDLQQKIEHEIKMRDGTTKLLAASRHPAQLLEAAKTLLSSNVRMIAYMSELQRRKTEEVMGKNMALEGNQVPCKAKVAVSEIRIPLMWKDTDHFKNKGDHRRYAVFCLLKIGTEIYDTQLIKEVDRSMTDITFDDVLVFQNIPHDFECRFEVYCHKLHDDLTIASTPRRLKKKINEFSNSVGRSVGKRLSGLKEDPDYMASMLAGPKYDVVGQATLTLSDVQDEIGIFDLNKNMTGSSDSELPLFGNFGCKMVAQPNSIVQDTTVGYLNVQGAEEDSEWTRLWCVLRNLQLNCWYKPGHVDILEPVYIIPVTKDSQISDSLPHATNKKHTFLILSLQEEEKVKHTLAAESKSELTKWWDGLQQHLLDQAMWKHACENVMEIPSQSDQKAAGFLHKQGSLSLYDEIRDSPMKPNGSGQGGSGSSVLRRHSSGSRPRMGRPPSQETDV